jgi:hypothetical protein
MSRKTSHGRSKINQRLITAPVGAVLTLAWLKAQGISGKLANYYVKSGWLHQIGEGAFTLRPETPDWLGAVFGLQQKVASLHPGSRTALELASLAHFLPLGENYPIHLFGRSTERLPAWFRRLPWASRVKHIRTNFLPAELGLREHQTGSFAVQVSTPERAILEFLLHLSADEASYEHASLVFEGLGTLRASLVQQLLEKCSSVKVKRLFLHLAERHGHPWFKELDQAKVSIGSGKRVIVPGGRLDPKYLITVPAVGETPSDAP